MLCIRVYQIIKNLGPGLYNTTCLMDRLHFWGFSITRNQREAQMFHLAAEVGKVYCFLAEKGNFNLISELKYGRSSK